MVCAIPCYIGPRYDGTRLHIYLYICTFLHIQLYLYMNFHRSRIIVWQHSTFDIEPSKCLSNWYIRPLSKDFCSVRTKASFQRRQSWRLALTIHLLPVNLDLSVYDYIALISSFDIIVAVKLRDSKVYLTKYITHMHQKWFTYVTKRHA